MITNVVTRDRTIQTPGGLTHGMVVTYQSDGVPMSAALNFVCSPDAFVRWLERQREQTPARIKEPVDAV